MLTNFNYFFIIFLKIIKFGGFEQVLRPGFSTYGAVCSCIMILDKNITAKKNFQSVFAFIGWNTSKNLRFPYFQLILPKKANMSTQNACWWPVLTSGHNFRLPHNILRAFCKIMTFRPFSALRYMKF